MYWLFSIACRKIGPSPTWLTLSGRKEFTFIYRISCFHIVSNPRVQEQDPKIYTSFACVIALTKLSVQYRILVCHNTCPFIATRKTQSAHGRRSRRLKSGSSRGDPEDRLGESTGANPSKHALENTCVLRMSIVYVNHVKIRLYLQYSISCEDIQTSISSPASSTSFISVSFSVVGFRELVLVIESRRDGFFPFETLGAEP